MSQITGSDPNSRNSFLKPLSTVFNSKRCQSRYQKRLALELGSDPTPTFNPPASFQIRKFNNYNNPGKMIHYPYKNPYKYIVQISGIYEE